MTTVYTIGHSNKPVTDLLTQLRDAGIRTLVDVRRYPASRRHPQFNSNALRASLREAGIDYAHAEDLGGRREPQSDSINLAIAEGGLRGYADYTATAQFESAAQILLGLAERQRTAVMCAEASPDSVAKNSSPVSPCLMMDAPAAESRSKALSTK